VSPQDTTVSRVAAEAGGFFQLGRFVGDYLAMFGEHPAGTNCGRRRRPARCFVKDFGFMKA